MYNRTDYSLIALVMENIDNLIERVLGSDRVSVFVTKKVCCCCEECQNEIKYRNSQLKHCHLYSLTTHPQTVGKKLSLYEHYSM